MFARIISVRENLPSKHPVSFSPGLRGSHVVTCTIGGRHGVSLWEFEIADWGQRLGIDQFAKTGGQRL